MKARLSMDLKSKILLQFLLISYVVGINATLQPCNGIFSAIDRGFYLDYLYMIKRFRALDIGGCMSSCGNHRLCISYNFCLYNNTCELNYVDKSTNPQNYGRREGYIYGDKLNNRTKRVYFRSCAEAKQINPTLTNGNYWVKTNGGKKVHVYCDMVNFGGGWTLVASISSFSRNHLRNLQYGCANDVCVPYTTTRIPPRKLSDIDIRHLASNEAVTFYWDACGIPVEKWVDFSGTFRVDVVKSSPYTVFYQIPSGPENFVSTCHGRSCPRIIISYHYPYRWESNCKGTSVGYHIHTHHYVFDGYDDNECSSGFSSSQFIGKRVLYGYPYSFGIYPNLPGLLFVK